MCECTGDLVRREARGERGKIVGLLKEAKVSTWVAGECLTALFRGTSPDDEKEEQRARVGALLLAEALLDHRRQARGE